MIKREKKYNYELLKSFCDENKIILSKDYSNEKLTGRITIEGQCKNYLVCKNMFSKNFDSLIKNAECYDCARHNKHGYGSLINYCDKNKIILLKDYSKEKLNKLSVIEGNCINYDICGKTFKKTLHQLFNNACCSNCAVSSNHNYFTLKTFCDENEIILTKDYSKEKITDRTVIEGYCPNYEKCKNTFSKLYLSLENNIYCHDCATKVKYNYETLITLCEKYSVKLLKDYSQENLTLNTQIFGECPNYGICNNTFEKHFHSFIDYKGNFSGYCVGCTNINKKNKTENTCLEKYGVDHVFKVKEIVEKKEKTNIEKYGNKCVLKNKEVKAKCIETNIKKYGCNNPMQNEDIIKKTKETNLKKYGFSCTALNSEVILKKENTNMEKYGVKHYFSSELIKEKIKATNLEKYGTEYYLQSEDKQEKSKLTCMKKYGTEHHMQDPTISEKTSKNSYLTKEYKFPSGKIIDIQGYENYGLDILINDEQIDEEDIVTKRKKVPKLWYIYKNKKHRHFVDIFVESQNRCVEVKSTWTFEKNKEEVFAKQKSAKELGYIYNIWVFDREGKLAEKYN